MLKLLPPLKKKKLLIFWYLSMFFTSPLVAITHNNNGPISEQNIDKKQEFYSHLCQLQTYMIDPTYKKVIKQKYSTTVIFPKEVLQQYNANSTVDYTIQDLLNRPSLLSPFSISNSAKIFKKELEIYNITQLSAHISTFAQFLKQPPKNKELNHCLSKQYPKLTQKLPIVLNLNKKKQLLEQLKNTSLLYQSWLTENKKQLDNFKQLLAEKAIRYSIRCNRKPFKKNLLKIQKETLSQITNSVQKVHTDITNHPLHSILINLKSKWSPQLGHYLYPQLTQLGKSLVKSKSLFTAKTYALLDKKLHYSITSLQKLTKNICQKNITNLHHNIFAVEASILKHSSRAKFPIPVIAEDLAAYCYLNSTQPKKSIGATWKSYTGLGIVGTSIIARLFNWIGKKTLIASGLASTVLFATETYDNWGINSSNRRLYNINKYHSKTKLKDLKNWKKNQDLVYLEGGLLLLPTLISKLTNLVRSRKIQKVSSQFQLSPHQTTAHFLNTSINSPSKWWPYYKALIQQQKIKPFKQFFWAKHNQLKALKITNAQNIRKKANDFFSRINQNYITPARYLKDSDFVSTLVFLKNTGVKNFSTETKASLNYIQKLINKSQLYKVNVNKVITQGLEATVQLKKLNTLKIKSKYFANNKKIKISNWPIAKNDELLNTNSITFHSYNEYKAFFSELKIRANYLPSNAIDDLFQKKQLYIEQLKQASNIRKLQIIESKLQLLKKTQKLNGPQTHTLNNVKNILKNSDIYPPNRAFKKIFLKELVSEVQYLKQGVHKRQVLAQKAYSSFPEESIQALTKTTSFLANNIKKIFWIGAAVSITSGATIGVQQFGLDYILAQLQDKMRNISRFFSKNGYTNEEKTCALNSKNFKKFIICYNKLIRKEIKLDLLKIKNFEFKQNENTKEQDVYEYKIKLYSSIKKKLRKYTYKLLELRSRFNIQEFFYNLQPQITEALNAQFIYQVLKEIKLYLGEHSFQYAKSILTLKTNTEDSFKKITDLNKNVSIQFKHTTVLQTILYQIYNNQKKYSIYFKNTGQLPIELKALIQNKDLIQLQKINEYEEFNTLSGGLLEEVDFFQNLVF